MQNSKIRGIFTLFFNMTTKILIIFSFSFLIQETQSPLCEVCDNYGSVWQDKYGSTNFYVCNLCKDSYIIAQRQIIYVIFLSVYFIYSVKKTMNKATKYIICQTLRRMNSLLIGTTGEKDQISFFIKLSLNFIQITSLLSNPNLNYLKFSFFNVTGIVGSPQALSSNSLDCLISDYDDLPIEFTRAIWVSCMPIIYLLLAITSVGIIIGLKRLNKDTGKRFFYTTYTFGFISFQSGTAAHLLQTMSCTQIGKYSYVKSQLNKICYSNEHLKFTILITLPLFLFWVLIIPLFILWRIFRIRMKLFEPIQVCKYGFLCLDYKQKYYYWEFIRILFRLSILLIGNIFSEKQIGIKCGLIVIVIIFYNYLLESIKPYSNKNSQKLDYQSNQALCMLFLLFLIQVTEQDTSIAKITSVLQFILQLFCYIFLIQKIVSFTVNNNVQINYTLRKKFPCLRKYIKKISTGQRRFQLWRKIKQYFDHLRETQGMQKQTQAKSLNIFQEKIERQTESAIISSNERDYKQIQSDIYDQLNKYNFSPKCKIEQGYCDNLILSNNNNKIKESNLLFQINKSLLYLDVAKSPRLVFTKDNSPSNKVLSGPDLEYFQFLQNQNSTNNEVFQGDNDENKIEKNIQKESQEDNFQKKTMVEEIEKDQEIQINSRIGQDQEQNEFQID